MENKQEIIFENPSRKKLKRSSFSLSQIPWSKLASSNFDGILGILMVF